MLLLTQLIITLDWITEPSLPGKDVTGTDTIYEFPKNYWNDGLTLIYRHCWTLLVNKTSNLISSCLVPFTARHSVPCWLSRLIRADRNINESLNLLGVTPSQAVVRWSIGLAIPLYAAMTGIAVHKSGVINPNWSPVEAGSRSDPKLASRWKMKKFGIFL